MLLITLNSKKMIATMDPSKSDIKFGTSSNRPRKLMLLNVLIVLSVLAATFMVVNMVVTFLGW